MKMDFSKDELAMVYQYAAGTKEGTLAGLKEIVPVIHDRQTREIVESTIRKLDAIPEPERWGQSSAFRRKPPAGRNALPSGGV